MKKKKVISLGQYRAGCDGGSGTFGQSAVGKSLPSTDRLWELLDRNISLSVWEKEH